MKRIVSDTGPILHLSQAQALFLLARAGEVVVPPAVDNEVTRHMADWQEVRPSWVTVQGLASPHDRQAQIWHRLGELDIGEAEALALSQQLRADWFLTDDMAARWMAQSIGLEVHGSIGVLLWAADAGYLDRAESYAISDRLKQSSLWLSTEVMVQAEALLAEIFP